MQRMPSLSIVVEWENAKNSDFGRGRAMLSALSDQLQGLQDELPAPPELILVFDEEDGSAVDLRDRLAGGILDRFPGTVRMASSRALDYYQQKNFGAQLAKHNAILLVDCDVIPCGGWLRHLLNCYVEEQADVVCGATHMEQKTLYEKAFALFWFFPLASEMHHRGKASYFFANNVLFRADLLKSTPFPECPLVRGKCVLLARTLVASSRSIYCEPNAKVIHPPPNGLAHFIKRALCSGQDSAVMSADRGLRAAFRRCRWQIKNAAKRIVHHRHEVELAPWGIPAAVGIAASYFGLEFIGETIGLINPHVIRKHLRV
jgi:Glycosyl transferase family 2